MSIARYAPEIEMGTKVLTNVTEQIHAAKADDGKVDASEALSIFISALLSSLSIVASAPERKG